ncbi:hypothetical protein STENM223S_01612 [Streptomyces tendae]
MPKRTRVAALAALAAEPPSPEARRRHARPAPRRRRPRGKPRPRRRPRPPGFWRRPSCPHPSGWTAGPVTDGFPASAYCLGEGVPAYDYRHRLFRTDLDTGAVQVTVVTGSAAKGKALAALLNEEIRGCAARMERLYPEIEAEGRATGRSVEEGGVGARAAHRDVVRGPRTSTCCPWGGTEAR